ncbi:TLD domain-containing protein 1 [Paramecium bursaria]
MGNCLADRSKFPILFEKKEKLILESTYRQLVSMHPQSRKHDRLFEENFESLFPENPKLGVAIHWFMIQYQNDKLPVTYQTFLKIIECLILGRSENDGLRNLTRIHTLLMIISLFGTTELQYYLVNTDLIEISYLQTMEFVTSFQKMMIGRKQINEIPAKSLVDAVFLKSSGCIRVDKLCQKFSTNMPLLDQIIKDYFEAKLLNKQTKSQLVGLLQPSYILNMEWTSLLKLIFTQTEMRSCSKLHLLYSTNVNQKDFEQLSHILDQNDQPTLTAILIEDGGKEYVLGGLSNSKWNDDGQPGGTKDDLIFQIIPTFQVYLSQLDKYASRPQYNYLNSKNKDLKLGLGFGGEMGKEFRIFINQDLINIYVREFDKTYEKGLLGSKPVFQTKIKVLEIWALEQTRGHTHMKDFMKEQQDDSIDFVDAYEPQFKLDEDISSFQSGIYEFEEKQEFMEKADSSQWDAGSNDSDRGFDQIVVVNGDGQTSNEIIVRGKSQDKKDAFQQATKVDTIQQSTKGDVFENETVQNQNQKLQSSNFDKAYVVTSGTFGQNSNWDAGDSTNNNDQYQIKSMKFGQTISKDLDVITEEMKESTNTQC